MRIEALQAQSFQALRHVDLKLSTPITLVCGPNEAGKSSVVDALRFVLLGESARVRRKSDFHRLLPNGEKDGYIRAVVDGQCYERSVRTGNCSTSTPSMQDALPFVLDAQRFASLDPNRRRQFLFDLMGVSIGTNSVCGRMLERGCDAAKIERVRPLLRSGFEDAKKEAADQATQGKGAWRQITGEIWGSKKGDSWRPPDLDRASTERTRADLIAKIKGLESRQSELQAAATPAQGFLTEFTCPHCGALSRVAYLRGELTILDDGERESAIAMSPPEAHQELNRAKESLRSAHQELGRIEAVLDGIGTREQKAQAEHAEILAWTAIADALSPSGIPGELLAEALGPVNRHLANIAVDTGWRQVRIDPDMEITADELSYELLSESARWRVDVMLAATIATMSGLRLLVVDRFDVLDLPNRAAFLRWLQSLAGHYDTILVTGTLKEPPRSLPPTFSVYWLERGRVIDAQTDAA